MSIELKKRADKIVLMRKQGYTFEEISKVVGITRQRVHQIYKKVSQRIKV